MNNQIDITIALIIIYRCDEIRCSMPCIICIVPQISEWNNYNGYSALVSFSKSFLADFPAKQHLQVDKSTFSMYSVLYLSIDQHQVHGSLILEPNVTRINTET